MMKICSRARVQDEGGREGARAALELSVSCLCTIVLEALRQPGAGSQLQSALVVLAWSALCSRPAAARGVAAHAPHALARTRPHARVHAHALTHACTPTLAPSQASEPVTPNSTVNIWTRLSLRTVQEKYPEFNKASVRELLTADNANAQG